MDMDPMAGTESATTVTDDKPVNNNDNRLLEIQGLLGQLYPATSLAELQSLSRIDRSSLTSSCVESIPFQYGETDVESFYWILTACPLSPSVLSSACVFADLGCGGGKLIAAAALLLAGKCRRIIGIEILSSLCSYARDRIQQLYGLSNMSISLPAIDIICADFLKNKDWYEADIIFSCSTLFTESMMHSLSKACEKTKVGSYIITVSQPLSLPVTSSQPMFILLAKQSLKMSWGPATVYIYQKQHNRQMEHVILRAFQKKLK